MYDTWVYMNLMETTNQKPIIDICQSRERNPNITLKRSHKVTREDSKRIRNRTTKATRKHLQNGNWYTVINNYFKAN